MTYLRSYTFSLGQDRVCHPCECALHNREDEGGDESNLWRRSPPRQENNPQTVGIKGQGLDARG